MKKLFLVALVAVSALVIAPLAMAADGGDLPGGVVVDVLQLTGTVTALDAKTGVVTIQGEDGGTLELNAKQAKNLDQVKVGDKVVADFVQSLALYVSKPDGGPAVGAAQVVGLAPKGQKPGGLVANVVQIKAQVEAVDTKANTISLKGPAGNVHTFNIAPDAKDFDKVQKGDDVVLRYTEAVAIAVKKP